MCIFVCCVLYVVPLPRGKTPFAVQLNNNNIIIIIEDIVTKAESQELLEIP
jgi:hypothetical protein